MALNVNPCQVVNNTTNEKAIEQVKSVQLHNVNTLLTNSIICNYELTGDQFDRLSKMFAPRPIRYGSKIVKCAHPIAAFLNHYANEQCKRESSRFQQSIDIGGTPLRTPKRTHMCIKDDCIRTSQRYTEAAFSQIKLNAFDNLDNNEKHDFTGYLTNNKYSCLDGAENCYFKAPYAYSTNVYDIKPADLITIFINHNLIVYDTWIFLPANIMDYRLQSDTDIYRNRYVVENGTEYFKFDLLDNSDIYKHEAKTWRFYATCPIIRCGDFSISIEHKISIASFFHIRMTRVENITGYKSRMFCLSKIVTDLIVPDMYYYATSKDFTRDPFRKCFAVSAGFVKRAMAYATSINDVKFDFNTFSTFCNAIKTSVRYNQGAAAELVYEGIDPSTDDFERIKMSLFILAAIQRYKRTQGLSHTFNYMKRNQPNDNLFNGTIIKIKHNIKTIWQDLFGTDVDMYLSEKFIYDVEIYEPQDVEVDDDEHFEHIYHAFYPFHKFENHQNDKESQKQQKSLVASDSVETENEEEPSEPEMEETKQADPPKTKTKPPNKPDQTTPSNKQNKPNVNDKKSDKKQQSPDKGKLKPKDDGKDNNKNKEKQNTPKKTNNDNKPIVPVKKCETILHNPSGEGGLCGLRCFEFLAGDEVFVPDEFTNDAGETKKFSQNWWCDEEMAEVAKQNNISIAIHHSGVLIDTYICDGPRLNVNLASAHWTVVKCDCPLQSYYVGNYENLNDDAYIYVNCANHSLTDGAGQAKAFNYMFKGYKTDLLKQLKDGKIGHTYSLNYMGYDLFLAVAHNFTADGNRAKSIEVYHTIFKELQKFSIITGKPVYLPMIGTEIFGNDLCCFKEVLKKYNFPRVLCFHTEAKKRNYDNIYECKHGGYRPLVPPTTSLTFTNTGKYNNKYYKLEDKKIDNRMAKKFDDIFAYAVKRYDIPMIYDLTAAPGAFYERAKEKRINCIPFVYTGPGALKWNSKDDHIKYEDIWELEEYLTTKKNALMMYDYFPDSSAITLFCKLVNRGNVVIFKIDPHDDEQLDTKFNTITNANCYVELFSNDYSNNKSNEIYVLMSNDCYQIKHAVFDNDDYLLKKIQDAEDNDVAICTCDDIKAAESLINSDTTFKYKYDPMATGYVGSIADHMKEFSKGLDEERLDVLKNAIECIRKETTIPTINGVAGARKSQVVLKGICKECGIMVAPFKAITNEVKSKNKPGSTFMVFLENILMKGKRYRYVFLDEVYCYPPTYIALVSLICDGSTIIGLGDDKQITNRDYNAMDASFEVKYRPNKEYLDLTHRMPKFVVDFIAPYVKCKTTSSVEGYIELNDLESISNIKPDKNNVLLTFTQSNKDMIAKKYKFAVDTVNGAQGKTYANVHVYTPDLCEIRYERVRYIYTAASRATHKLVLHGTEETNQQFLTIIGTEAHNMLESFDIIPTSVETIVLEPPKQKIHTTVKSTKNVTISQQAVEEILDKVYVPTNNLSVGVIDIKTDIIPTNHSKDKLKFTVDMANGGNVNLQGKRFSHKNYVRTYHPKNNMQTLQTAITRYMKEGKNIPKEYIKRYMAGVDKFMVKGWCKAIQKGNTVENRMASLADYLTELQKKYPKDKDVEVINTIVSDPSQNEGLMSKVKTSLRSKISYLMTCIQNDEPNKISDLEKPWFDSYHTYIQFHLKRQPKSITDKGYDAIYKAGQGISAWSKLLNILFSVMTRTFSREFKKYVKPNVQLSYGESDASLSKFFTKYGSVINSVNHDKMVADFSEFDSSQEKQGIMSSILILKFCGFSTKITNFYMEMRQKWTLSARTEGDVMMNMTLCGEFMQHSGQPFTLDGNTLFNMACMGMCYNIKQMCFAAFKGDDSIIVAESITEQMDGKQTCIDVCGYKIKAHKLKITEYIANIILPDGTFFPDVIRRVSRILSKLYMVKSDWDEQRQSIVDCMDVIFDEERLNYGAQVASYYYAQMNIHITASEVIALLQFMHGLSQREEIDHIKPQEWTILSI